MSLSEKPISKLIISIVLLSLIFFIFFPYFTSDFLDLRQQQENEENQERILNEALAKKEAARVAERKIYLTGKFDPAIREDFVLIPAQYTLGPNQIYLRKETLEAFIQMRDYALKDAIDLKIASATRNFDYQKTLWNNKWSGVTLVDGKNLSLSLPDGKARFEKILEYSAVPSTSRHHWGTDIDINGAIPSYFDQGRGKKEYEWLKENAYLFGFCQTYNLKGTARPTGYNEEKWHWSYLPLATDFTREYKTLMKDEDIEGFLGDEYAPELNLIENYVLSINSECM